jgi:chloramphenicol-sensitive protein RarD
MLSTSSEHTKGMWYGVAAYVVWGLSPLFWNLIDGVAATDLLVFRVAFSLPILAIAITMRGLWRSTVRDFSNAASRRVTVAAAILLAVNWGLFIWAVTNGNVLEASLGYFINPLVSVALGVIVLHERLRRPQWVAIGIATAGVIGMGIRLGSVPWISLTLAFSFGVYGLLKKSPAAARPLPGLFGEITVLVLPALILLVAVRDTGTASVGLDPLGVAFMVGTGVITVVPLLLFGAAAQRIKLATVGILQYIAPTLQLLVGVLLLDEHLTADRMIGFVMVWIALVLYTVDNVRSSRSQPAVA